jgi:hypothetical protein
MSVRKIKITRIFGICGSDNCGQKLNNEINVSRFSRFLGLVHRPEF